MPIMLPSGIDIRIREDLASGAGRTQTTLIIDPIITIDGHRVLMTDIGDKGFGKIEQGTPREELISWTGITDNITTYTLTGVTWGINFYNLTGSVQTNKYRHISGSTFRITTDMHFIAEQYRDKDNNLFESSSDFDIKSNELKLGDGTSTSNKVLKAQNGDANEPFIEYNETTGKWNISNDGVNSYDPEQGGSGVTAGDGIDIVGGVVSVDADEIVDDEALTVVGNRIKTVVNEDTGLFKDANGLNIDVIDPDNPVAQSPAKIIGGTDVVLNNFRVLSDTGATIEQTTSNADKILGGVSLGGQNFISSLSGYLETIELNLQRGSILTSDLEINLYLADGSGFPTGASLWSTSTDLTTSSAWYIYTLNLQLTPNTYYVIVLKYNGVGSGSDWVNWKRNSVDVYAGGTRIESNDAGSSWSNATGDHAFKVYFTGGANDGAVKATIDGVEYDNVSIDLSTIADEDIEVNGNSGSGFNIYSNNYYSQSFTANNSGKLTNVSLELNKAGTPTGVSTVKIYVSGTGADDDKPTGSPLATSNDVLTDNDLTTSFQFIDFSFDLELEAGTKYVIVISSTSNSSINCPQWRYNNSNPYSGGNKGYSNNAGSTWSISTQDFGFKVNISTTIESVSDLLQTAIRTATSSTEIVQWSTDHFEITSTISGKTSGSQVLKLQPPTTGTDISGAGYLDLGANATEVAGDGDDYKLVRLDEYGYIPADIIKNINGTGNNYVANPIALNTVYQNTASYPIVVSLTAIMFVGSGGTNTGVYAKIGTTSTPNVLVGQSLTVANSYGDSRGYPIVIIVPAGQYYKFETYGNGSITLISSCSYQLL